MGEKHPVVLYHTHTQKRNSFSSSGCIYTLCCWDYTYTRRSYTCTCQNFNEPSLCRRKKTPRRKKAERCENDNNCN